MDNCPPKIEKDFCSLCPTSSCWSVTGVRSSMAPSLFLSCSCSLLHMQDSPPLRHRNKRYPHSFLHHHHHVTRCRNLEPSSKDSWLRGSRRSVAISKVSCFQLHGWGKKFTLAFFGWLTLPMNDSATIQDLRNRANRTIALCGVWKQICYRIRKFVPRPEIH